MFAQRGNGSGVPEDIKLFEIFSQQVSNVPQEEGSGNSEDIRLFEIFSQQVAHVIQVISLAGSVGLCNWLVTTICFGKISNLIL